MILAIFFTIFGNDFAGVLDRGVEVLAYALDQPVHKVVEPPTGLVVDDQFVVARVCEAKARRVGVLVEFTHLDMDDILQGQQEVFGGRVVDQPTGDLLGEFGERELAKAPKRVGKRNVEFGDGFRH